MYRRYFYIQYEDVPIVVTARSSSTADYEQYGGSDKHHWFEDDSLIRSKLYTDKVLTMTYNSFTGIFSVILQNYLSTSSQSQQWIYQSNYLSAQGGTWFRLAHNGGKLVGIGRSTQKWYIKYI